MNKAQINLLLVDDVAEMRSYLAGCLKHMGFLNVSSAKNGREALNAVRKHDFDMIFLDIEMPEPKGLEVLKQIRQFDNRTFITMLSCHSSLNNVKQAIENGANGFIVKPFSAEKITESMTHFERYFNNLPAK